MELVYKKCEHSDIESIYQHTSRYILRHEDPTMVDMQETLKLVRTKIEGNYDHYVSVLSDGQVCGHYHVLKQIDLTCLLDDLFVAEQYRDSGIGTAILQHIHQSIDESIYAYVYLSDAKTIRFLEKNGYCMKRLISKSRAVFYRNIES